MHHRQQLLGLLLIRRNRRLNQGGRSLTAVSRRGYVILAAVVGLVLAASGLLLALVYASLTTNLPSIALIPASMKAGSGLLLQPTRFYDRTGLTLLYSLENPGIPRRFLPLDPYNQEGLSQTLAQTTVAALEPAFWQSPGFDLGSLGTPQPATIAERLVDSLLLSDEPAGLAHSLRRQLLAGQLVAAYGRQAVLEWFLNSAYFGHLAYGADSAARLYLDKSASQLNLAESALLVGVLSAPALNPLDSPAAALEQQRTLLDRLVAQGQITAVQYQSAIQQPVSLRPALAQPQVPAQAFITLVMNDLERRFGRSRLERGGLTVITSLDSSLQNQLTCTLLTQLARLEGKTTSDALPQGSPSCEAARLLPALAENQAPLPPGLNASALLLDPSTGQVMAFLGDTSAAGESALVALHQPGSLLTPFVAVAAFTRGMSPASLVWDIPASPAAVSLNPDGRRFRGPLRLRSAIANDTLSPLSQVLLQIGAANVWQLAEPLGLRGLAAVKDQASILQSGGETSLVELAQAYSVFANQGTLSGTSTAPGDPIQPVVVLSVRDQHGRQLFTQGPPETRSVLSQQLAYLVHNVLSDEPARWPSLGYPNSLEIGRPAGAKVGLADGGRQVWAAGYTPQLTAVTWIGLPPEAAPGVRLDVRAAAGLWHALVQYSTRDLAPIDWQMPAGISTLEVCDPSGLLPTSTCPTRVSEVFLDGNEPTSLDTLYSSVQINRETGLLATVFTPPELVEDRVYMSLPPEAQEWGRLAGLAVPPSDYDRIQPPTPSTNVQISQPALFAYVHGKVTFLGSAAGSSFASYRLQAGAGLNPTEWIQIGTGDSPLSSGTLGTWDTQGQNGLFAVRLQVIRQNQLVESAIIQLTVDNIPPVVQVTSPADGESIPSGASRITLQVSAVDNVGIQKVEYKLDGILLGDAGQAPFSLLAQPLPAGPHTLSAVAYDLAGNTSQSSTITFTVK